VTVKSRIHTACVRSLGASSEIEFYKWLLTNQLTKDIILLLLSSYMFNDTHITVVFYIRVLQL
jgi:hypothetical protein